MPHAILKLCKIFEVMAELLPCLKTGVHHGWIGIEGKVFLATSCSVWKIVFSSSRSTDGHFEISVGKWQASCLISFLLYAL